MPRKKTVIPDEQPMEAMAAAETGGEENPSQASEAGALPESASNRENAGEDGPADGAAPFDALPPAVEIPPGESAPGEGVPGEAPYGDMPGEEPLPAGDGTPEGEEPPAVPPSDGPAHEDMPSGGNFPVGEESPFPEAGGATEVQQPQKGAEAESDDPEYGALLQEFGEASHGETGAEEPLTLGPPPGEEPIGDVPPLSRLNRRRGWTVKRPPRPGVPGAGPAIPRAQPPPPQTPAVTGY